MFPVILITMKMLQMTNAPKDWLASKSVSLGMQVYDIWGVGLYYLMAIRLISFASYGKV